MAKAILCSIVLLFVGVAPGFADDQLTLTEQEDLLHFWENSDLPCNMEMAQVMRIKIKTLYLEKKLLEASSQEDFLLVGSVATILGQRREELNLAMKDYVRCSRDNRKDKESDG